MKKIVVLLSGGLDSTTVLYMAKGLGFEVYPIAIDYKQRHKRELLSAKAVVEALSESNNVKPLRVVKINSLDFGASALTTGGVDVPSGDGQPTIPVTYVPSRNTILVGIAASYAEAIGATEVWTGFNAVDYSGYPDCRPEYVEALNALFSVGTKAGIEGKGIKVRAPLIQYTKQEIVACALEHSVPINLTWSCYKGQESACGVCDSCKIRLNAFKALGKTDTVGYKTGGAA